MKITHLIAAAGVAIATLGATAPASAQGMRDHRDDRGYGHRGDDRRGYDHRRDDRRDGYRGRGHHYGYENGRRGRNCRIVYRHHQRVRVCYR